MVLIQTYKNTIFNVIGLSLNDIFKPECYNSIILLTERKHMIKVVLFDFGGVIAEEGFREGLEAIARKNNLDASTFFFQVVDLINSTGYLTGKCEEHDFWESLRIATRVKGSDISLRVEILSRFIIRLRMLEVVELIKNKGLKTGILSDQTNWLDEINLNHHFYQYFDYIFNSFKLGKSKSDSSLFTDVCEYLGVKPEEILFIDDNSYHILRANNTGYHTIYFTGYDEFMSKLEAFIRLN